MSDGNPQSAARRLRAGCAILLLAALETACIRGSGPASGGAPPPPPLNIVTVTVDGGPAAAPGAINHPYVTVRVCAPGSQTQCANIDHVLLDTGSTGLRLVRSVLAANAVTLAGATDATGQTIEECVHFSAGDTWGPVALADVSMAGEVATKVPVHVLDDTGAGAPAPATCGPGGTLINGVTGFFANGVLGVSVLARDCGAGCAAAALTTPQPAYYGCSAAGVCTGEAVAIAAQVANPVALFGADNNGLIVNMPALQNPNGEPTVQGQLIFGIGTQSDNALPATGLTLLGADANGFFTATYNGGTTVRPALIDSGTGSFAFDDPTIAVCSSGTFLGYYCPAVAPLSLTALNAGVNVNVGAGLISFALADPGTFVANAAAFANLGGGGGSSKFVWGMPFFYGRKIYFGIDQKAVGAYTGPFYAY